MEATDLCNDENKSLIYAIIRCAISDGLAYKRPRSPSLRISRTFQNRIIKFFQLIEYAMEYDRRIFRNLSVVIALLNHSIELFNRKLSTPCEELSWEARAFLKRDNLLFDYFCNLIDVEASYFERHITKLFYNHDNGIHY